MRFILLVFLLTGCVSSNIYPPFFTTGKWQTGQWKSRAEQHKCLQPAHGYNPNV